MKEFHTFRVRILSALAAASVAQGCGGAVTDSSGEGDTRTTDPSDPTEMPPSPTATGTSTPPQPTTIPTTTSTPTPTPTTTSAPTPTPTTTVTVDPEPPPGCPPGVTDPATALEAACGMGGYCDFFDDTDCIAWANLSARLKPCAAPLTAGRCPPAGDLVPVNPSSCEAIVGGAVLSSGQCCYASLQISCAVPGRPLRVGGIARLPDVTAGPAHADKSDENLSDTERRSLAEAWLRDARYEHASVASFARLTLRLLALDAPTELVRDSQRASLDEVEHARRCFSLASRYAGQELRAGALPVDGALEAASLTDVAIETVAEGCIGETVAALLATEQRRHATDPDVRDTLALIAEDETRHAELGWRIVAWAIGHGGDGVREKVREAFRRALSEIELGAGEDAAHAEALVRHGRLSKATERDIRVRVLREVVAPCAEALIGGNHRRPGTAAQSVA